MTENANIPDLWTDSECYADQYQNDAQIRKVCQILELPSATALVDIGCGNGVFAVAAASRFPDCAVVALDSLSSAVEETERRASSAQCVNLRAQVSQRWRTCIKTPRDSRSKSRTYTMTRRILNLGGIIAPGNMIPLTRRPFRIWRIPERLWLTWFK
jgi:hypothetical protein